MTQPTQAQIEAAAKAAFDYDVRNSRTTARWENARRFYLELCKYAITAAAQVGEQRSIGEVIDIERELREKAVAATIERCAQVAERYAVNIGEMAFTISAELRKLKDTP